MTRTYKNAQIARNMNGKWIVTHVDNSKSQHATLADAKEYIRFVAA